MNPDASLTVAIAHRPDNIEKAVTRRIPWWPSTTSRIAWSPSSPTTPPRPKDKTACTQADSLRATIRFIKTLHPRQIVVTGGSGAKETEDVFRVMGYLDVIEPEGVEWFDHNQAAVRRGRRPVRPPAAGDGQPAGARVREARLAGPAQGPPTATVTLAIKNIAMSYPAADFYGHPRVSQKLHPHNILKDKQAFLVGMLMRFPIDLAIVVGHPAMIGTGPVGGKAVETGLVIAGRNAVAVDTVGAFLLGFETLGVQHLHQAANSGSASPTPTRRRKAPPAGSRSSACPSRRPRRSSSARLRQGLPDLQMSRCCRTETLF